jgi:hypothetical protein
LFKGENEIDLVVSIKPDQKVRHMLNSVYERLTFFKPVVMFNYGIIKFEEDVKRILTSSINQGPKL